MESAQQPILSDEEKEWFEGFDFPFENLVLEGGGAKLFGGVGTVRVLEELGVLKKMKRFGGTSAGSFLATLLALGYRGQEIEELMAVDVKDKMEDEYSLINNSTKLYNLVNYYGLHYGTTLKKWLGKLVAKKMDGNPDATFWQLYKKTGKELVITATELMHKECMYFHVKTTPDRPIREAVFMSMAVPGFLRPTLDEDAVKDLQVFVDGGVFNNYPIHCFDGWFLSHGEENDFIKKQLEAGKKDKNFWRERRRFEGRNKKTIGIVVYSTEEDEKLRDDLEKRNQKYIEQNTLGVEWPKVPDTELRRKQSKNNIADYRRHLDAHLRFQQSIAEEAGHPLEDARRLAEWLHGGLGVEDEEYQTDFSDEDAALLFGRGVDAKTAIKTHMAKLDVQDDADGKVEHLLFDRGMVVKSSTGLELIRHTKSSSEHFAPRHLGNVGDFLMSLVNAYGHQIMMDRYRSADYTRTIGVDVDYVTTADYKMEDGDRSFLRQQSKIACLAFLDEYKEKNNLKKMTTN